MSTKQAFVGALAPGARSLAAPALAAGKKLIGPTASRVVGGAVNAAKGYTGLGTAKGFAGAAGNAASMAPQITGALTSGNKGPSVMGFKVGSAADSAILKRAALQLGALGPSELADIASYGAFIGAKLVDPVKHPVLHNVLDAGGLLGLAGTTAYGMTQNKAERMPGAKDILGLGLMGSALYDRATSGHGH